MKICIINGPNLNWLGKREPAVYGDQGFEAYLAQLRHDYPECQLDYVQSNVEGELINALQNCEGQYQGVILNAAAYTHTSVGIGDTVKAMQTPVIEVHISNTYARESFRHQSYIAAHARGVIIGFGLESYRLALQSFVK